MAAGQVLAVPPGYPAHLPRPVLRDGGLYLEPFPGFAKGSGREVTDTDIAWVMVALQPLIMQYAPMPYDVNWVIDGWGSGKAHIMGALSGYLGSRKSFGLPVSQENWLQLPREPSGFDKFLIGLNKALPDLMGKLFNSVLPGSGMLVKTLVGRETWSAPGGGVDLTPVYEQINEETGGGDSIIPGVSKDKLPLYAAGAALLLIGIYYYYDGDA